MYFTYIIRCKDDSLYTGYTTDIDRRMKEHENGINCKYTKVKGFKKLETYFKKKNIETFIYGIHNFKETSQKYPNSYLITDEIVK